jgi:hypothetical protein
VQIEEAPASDGPWILIDTLALSPVDADPATPQTRDFTTDQGTGANLWYRLIWVDGGAGTSEPTAVIQNVAIVFSAYASVEDLAVLLKLSASSAANRVDDLSRCLSAAALEIDSELSRTEPWDFSDNPKQLALLSEVNLERAVEHWSQGQSPFGIIGLGSETGPVYSARDSWERHARKLAPLKESFGIA